MGERRRSEVDRYEPKRTEPLHCDACGEWFDVGWGAQRVVVDPEEEVLDAWYFCSERCENEFMGDVPRETV